MKSLLKNLARSNGVTESLLRQWRGRKRKVSVGGVSLVISDLSRSLAHGAKVREFLQDVYGLHTIPFEEGDVVIDIGAHVGLEATFLAKRYPFLKILAFEPVPANFASLRHNLRANGITNVQAFRNAITRDNRDVTIWTDLVDNSGGGGHDRPAEHFAGRTPFRARSTTLDRVFEEHDIRSCKLLKIDCEGAEHEILMNSACLKRVEYLSGEFHIDGHLQDQGYTIDRLLEHVRRFIPEDHIRIVRDEHPRQ